MSISFDRVACTLFTAEAATMVWCGSEERSRCRCAVWTHSIDGDRRGPYARARLERKRDAQDRLTLTLRHHLPRHVRIVEHDTHIARGCDEKNSEVEEACDWTRDADEGPRENLSPRLRSVVQ